MYKTRSLSVNKRNNKKTWLWIILLFFTPVVISGLIYFIAYKDATNEKKLTQVLPTNTEKYVEIPQGSSLHQITQILQEKGVLKKGFIESYFFIQYSKSNNFAQKFQAGCHNFSGIEDNIPKTAQSLLKTVSDFKCRESIKILIPEGYTLFDMDKRFTEKNIFNQGEFLDCVYRSCDFSEYSFLPNKPEHREGYFFPDTYYLEKKDLNPENLAKLMLDQTQKNAKNLGLLNNNHSRGSLHEIIIMASIIEKEWGSIEEGPLISGVLWNRVDKKMRMGADATIRYALAKKSEPLTISDLNIENEFNTRKIIGLPPHPISAPGLAALKVATNPEKTDFLYYLHDPKKNIHFAKTNAGHNQNKQKYCGGSCE